MVESNRQLDLLFAALSDSTRRGILARAAEEELSIGEIATHHRLTFGAISKHIKVLERAGLVSKRRRGKEQVVVIDPGMLDVAREHIERYARLWDERFNKLEALLEKAEEEK